MSLRRAVSIAIVLAAPIVSHAVQAQNKSSSQPAKSQPATPPQSPTPANAPPSAGNTVAAPASQAPNWIVRCTSTSRQAPLECSIEQQALVQATGQQVSLVSIRVPGDTRQPVMMVQLPLGLFLPAGLTLQVDDTKSQNIAIQSCDQRACYVGLAVTPDMLENLKKGQKLNLAIQSMNRESITISHPLSDFATQYQKIQ